MRFLMGIFLCLLFAPLLWGLTLKEQLNQMLLEKEQVNRPTFSEWGLFAEHYAMVLFFSSSCPHCQRFIPIIKEIEKETGIKVYAYSVDGQGLPDYPFPLSFVPEVREKFFKGGSVTVPTVFIVNVETLSESLLTVGETSKTYFYNDLAAYKQSVS